MNKKNLLQITAITSLAFFGYSVASAQTATHAGNIATLDGLSIGDLPVAIQDVITNIENYRGIEQGINDNLAADVVNQQGVVGNLENVVLVDLEDQAAVKQQLIIDLTAANPLNPQIPIEQANLDTINLNIANTNTQIGTENVTLAGLEADVVDSNIKLALYDSALNPNIDPGVGPVGPIAQAEAAADAAATDIEQAVLDYTTVNSSANGLEGIIADIENVAAGDQAPVTNAITNADDLF
jgi:hypothetical protein